MQAIDSTYVLCYVGLMYFIWKSISWKSFDGTFENGIRKVYLKIKNLLFRYNISRFVLFQGDSDMIYYKLNMLLSEYTAHNFG